MDIKTSFPFQLLIGGTVGLIIIILLNCFAYLALLSPAATPFQGEWWTIWYPHYVVWSGFLLVGGATWLIET